MNRGSPNLLGEESADLEELISRAMIVRRTRGDFTAWELNRLVLALDTPERCGLWFRGGNTIMRFHRKPNGQGVLSIRPAYSIL